MKKENLTDLIYHGFLPLNSQKTSIRLSPQLYTTKDEKIHLDFLPLRPGCKEDPQWEDWNCYHSILSIGWPDCQLLLIPILEQIFPVMDPTNGDEQEEFDSCFSNWIGKADWERWILLVRENLTNLTSEEAEFLRSILGWLETALNYTDVIVVESNL